MCEYVFVLGYSDRAGHRLFLLPPQLCIILQLVLDTGEGDAEEDTDVLDDKEMASTAAAGIRGDGDGDGGFGGGDPTELLLELDNSVQFRVKSAVFLSVK